MRVARHLTLECGHGSEPVDVHPLLDDLICVRYPDHASKPGSAAPAPGDDQSLHGWFVETRLDQPGVSGLSWSLPRRSFLLIPTGRPVLPRQCSGAVAGPAEAALLPGRDPLVEDV